VYFPVGLSFITRLNHLIIDKGYPLPISVTHLYAPKWASLFVSTVLLHYKGHLLTLFYFEILLQQYTSFTFLNTIHCSSLLHNIRISKSCKYYINILHTLNPSLLQLPPCLVVTHQSRSTLQCYPPSNVLQIKIIFSKVTSKQVFPNRHVFIHTIHPLLLGKHSNHLSSFI
jgi:hypothetical protein